MPRKEITYILHPLVMKAIRLRRVPGDSPHWQTIGRQ